MLTSTPSLPVRHVTASDFEPQEMMPIELPVGQPEKHADYLRAFLEGLENSLYPIDSTGIVRIVRLKAPAIKTILASEMAEPISTEFFSVGVELSGKTVRFIGAFRLRYLGSVANVVMERKPVNDSRRIAPWLFGEAFNSTDQDGAQKKGGIASTVGTVLMMGFFAGLLSGQWWLSILCVPAFIAIAVLPESVRGNKMRERQELQNAIDQILYRAYSNAPKELLALAPATVPEEPVFDSHDPSSVALDAPSWRRE